MNFLYSIIVIQIILVSLRSCFGFSFWNSKPRERFDRVRFVDDPDLDMVNEVRFFLYTRKNKNPVQLFLGETQELRESEYNSKLPTYFVTHGWLTHLESDSIQTVKNALLTRRASNVIAVDWSGISMQHYVYAAKRTKLIGAYIANMTDYLRSQGTHMDKTCFLGHSLGAQVMGLAGNETAEKVRCLIGFDPAGFGFENVGPESSISVGDAKRVEIWHTAADGLKILKRQAGDFDYYPNGGSSQPGCWTTLCSHSRAYEYFVDSLIGHKKMIARKCDSYENFESGKCDENVAAALPILREEIKQRGKYFFQTARYSPYSLGYRGSRAPE